MEVLAPTGVSLLLRYSIADVYRRQLMILTRWWGAAQLPVKVVTVWR